MPLFYNFLCSVSVFDLFSWEYLDACMWCCWRRSRRSDAERPSLLFLCLYILVQISKAGQRIARSSSQSTVFMNNMHLPLLVNKEQHIRVLLKNASSCVSSSTIMLVDSQHYGWTADVTWTILTISLQPFWGLNMSLICCCQRWSSLYEEYASCVGPPKHQVAPLLPKMF